ncbi:MAG: sugar kinase [Planctomycetota bacterium]
MKQARAFAPGNVSCVFEVVPHGDPAKMHSLGMGFTIREGVSVMVTAARETTVSFNGQAVAFPAVERVAGALSEEPVKVTLESPLPLGCGFGLSGASALGTAYAVDTLLELGRSKRELAMAAHVAEVESLSGLGDVCAQFHGGWLVKLAAGDPLAAVVAPVADRPVYVRYFGPIDTRSVLASAEQTARVHAAAEAALAALRGLLDAGEAEMAAYVDISQAFAVDSGLLTDDRVRGAIAEAEAAGGHASMIMLGHAVFSTAPFQSATQTRLSHGGARVL